MKQDIRQEERRDTPLSTAALAHVDERTDEEKRIDRRPMDGAVRDMDRPPEEGRPTLVAQTNAKGRETVLEQNRVDGAADRQLRTPGKTPDEERATPLFSEQESKDLFAKWDALQVGFIDEPRQAVQQADNLVATAMKRTAEVFAEERSKLERQWDRGDNVSTEDLRIAMRRYRSFFRRMLAV
jgi:hypothetical protein